jgi:hypothetical protein
MMSSNATDESMSPSETAQFATLASDIAAASAEAIDRDDLDSIPDDSLGQVFGTVMRLRAAKAQLGCHGTPFGRNSDVTVTNVAIACTALLDSVGAWQTRSGIGRLNLSER